MEGRGGALLTTRLRSIGCTVELPLEGKRTGYQMEWLSKRKLGPADSVSHLFVQSFGCDLAPAVAVNLAVLLVFA